MQKAPFRLAIKPISEAEKYHFAPWNGLYRTAKWALSESETNVIGLWYGVYHKTIRAETAFIISVLTFLYTSFAKIFCQNLVKKNCKFVAGVSSHNACIGHEKGHGKCTSGGLLWFTWCGNINLLLRKNRRMFPFATQLYCGNIRFMLRQYQVIVKAIPIHCYDKAYSSLH